MGVPYISTRIEEANIFFVMVFTKRMLLPSADLKYVGLVILGLVNIPLIYLKTIADLQSGLDVEVSTEFLQGDKQACCI